MNSSALQIMNNDGKRCLRRRREAAANVAQQRQIINDSVLQIMNDDEKRSVRSGSAAQRFKSGLGTFNR